MPDRDSQTGVQSILSAIGAAAAAFLVTAAVLHAAIPNPLYLHADARSEKLVMLRNWHGKVFSSVFGSSHVHDGFSPRAFDAALAGSPIATRSANFAIEGGSQSEQRVMALEFVKQLESPAEVAAPSQPCLIMLEIGAGANFTNDHLVHPRAINIYDLPTTRLVTQMVSPAMSRTQRLGRQAYAYAAAGLYYANVGMLSNTIFAPPVTKEVIAAQSAGDHRGQIELTDNPAAEATIAVILAHRPQIPPLQPFPVSPGASVLVTQIAEASHVHPLSFVYFEMPKVSDVDGAYDFPDHLDVPTIGGTAMVPIINLARPDHFPQIYQPGLWHDDAHLNARGAALVSGVFAEQLKLWYAAHGLPQPCGG